MTDNIQPSFLFMVTLDPSDAYVPPELLSTAVERAPGAFQKATGLGAELEVTTYAEGGRNDSVHQLPLRHSWNRITLSRGIAIGADLWNWYSAGVYGALGARRDGAIIMQNAVGSAVMIWEFRAGLAARWTGPEFNAQENGLAIESLEIAHEGVIQIPGPGLAEQGRPGPVLPGA